MTEQLELVPATPKLTDRQLFALEQLEQTGGLQAEELGQRMHGRRGRHPADACCAWCFDEGKSVLYELRRKRLVVRRRSGVWQSLRGPGPRPNVDERSWTAQKNEIPF